MLACRGQFDISGFGEIGVDRLTEYFFQCMPFKATFMWENDEKIKKFSMGSWFVHTLFIFMYYT